MQQSARALCLLTGKAAGPSLPLVSVAAGRSLPLATVAAGHSHLLGATVVAGRSHRLATVAAGRIHRLATVARATKKSQHGTRAVVTPLSMAATVMATVAARLNMETSTYPFWSRLVASID